MGPRLDVSWIWPDGVSEVHASWDPGYGGTAPRGEVVVSRRAYADGGGLRISGTDGSALVITLRAISSADRRHGKPVEIAVPAEPPAARYAVSSTGSRWRRPKLVVVTVTARQAGRTPPFDIVWETGPNRPLAADQGRHQMSVAPLDLEAGRPRSVEFAEPTRARPLWVVCFPTTGASDGPSADTSSADAAATGAMSMGIVPVDRPPAPVLLLRLVPESLLPLTK